MTDFIGARSEIAENIQLAEECACMYVGEFGEPWSGSVDLDLLIQKVTERVNERWRNFESNKREVLTEIASKSISLIDFNDIESAHCDADNVLCELLTALNYEQVVKKYDAIDKWYA